MDWKMSGSGEPEDHHKEIAIPQVILDTNGRFAVIESNIPMGNLRTIRLHHDKSIINCQFTLLLCQFVIIYGYKQLQWAITRGGQIIEVNFYRDFKYGKNMQTPGR